MSKNPLDLIDKDTELVLVKRALALSEEREENLEKLTLDEVRATLLTLPGVDPTVVDYVLEEIIGKRKPYDEVVQLGKTLKEIKTLSSQGLTDMLLSVYQALESHKDINFIYKFNKFPNISNLKGEEYTGKTTIIESKSALGEKYDRQVTLRCGLYPYEVCAFYTLFSINIHHGTFETNVEHSRLDKLRSKLPNKLGGRELIKSKIEDKYKIIISLNKALFEERQLDYDHTHGGFIHDQYCPEDFIDLIHREYIRNPKGKRAPVYRALIDKIIEIPSKVQEQLNNEAERFEALGFKK